MVEMSNSRRTEITRLARRIFRTHLLEGRYGTMDEVFASLQTMDGFLRHRPAIPHDYIVCHNSN
jgi:hypothetical protein